MRRALVSLCPLLAYGLASILAAEALPSEPVVLTMDSPPPPRPEFTIIALPDTQLYSQDYPETFTAQTQWIVDHQDDMNIIFVTHLGDIVQEGDEVWQWANADASMSLLERPPGIPYGLCVGNHDSDPRGDPLGTINFNAFFPCTRYEALEWYGGHFDGDNDNSYQLFSAAGMDFIAIHLEYDESGDETALVWADNVLQSHASRRAMVSCHDLMSKTDPGEFSEHGQLVYDHLKGNPNLFLMLAGHCGSLQQGRRSDSFNDNTVWTLFCDYQRRPNGGDGWLRIMRFRPDYDDIKVTTYSVTLDAFETDDGAQFTVPYEMGGIKTVPPDFNRDRDVDMEDFGVLQACLTDPYEPVPVPCVAADFNHDDHVDYRDLDLFMRCLTGAGASVNLACME